MTNDTDTPTRTRDYVDAAGVRTYYEAAGEGEPLILLHGGMCTVETFEGQTPALAAQYRVYVPERRGHGRTADVEGPITYENMAQDTIAFMDALGIESAHLVGWSDGALVGLLVALRQPRLARKLVLIGQNVNLEGARPESLAMREHMTAESLPPMFEQMYAAVSPDGADHWGIVCAKVIQMWRADPAIELDSLAAVTAPTLVMLGDDDIVSIEHAAALQRALPSAQLAVVPGASHALPLEKPDLTNRLILDFLAVDQVPKMMSLSEAHPPS